MPALGNTSAAGWFGPAVDGVELLAEPEVLAKNGSINKVEGVILGTNLNEGRVLMPLSDPVPPRPARSGVGEGVSRSGRQYPPFRSSDPGAREPTQPGEPILRTFIFCKC